MALSNSVLGRLSYTPVASQMRYVEETMPQLAREAEYTNRRVNQELRPEQFAAQQQLEKDMASQYMAASQGRLPTATRNALAKGAVANLGGRVVGSADQSAATALYGQGADAYINSIRQLYSNYLTAHPGIEAAAAPKSLIEMEMARLAGNKAGQMQSNAQIAQLELQDEANLRNEGNQWLQLMMQQDAQRRAANNASAGAMKGALIAGAATLGAAGIAL